MQGFSIYNSVWFKRLNRLPRFLLDINGLFQEFSVDSLDRSYACAVGLLNVISKQDQLFTDLLDCGKTVIVVKT